MIKNTTHLEITSQIQIAGVIGHPIGHSFSPILHNCAFEYLNLNWLYLSFDVSPEELKGAVRGIKALGFRGINVTIPHKEKIIPFLDEISPEAKIIGAVNTVLNKNGKLLGYNTDPYGFVQPLNQFRNELKGKKAVVLGAGGASRAVLYGLLRDFDFDEIVVINRHVERAEKLIADFERYVKSGCQVQAFALKENMLKHHVPHAALVVNATSVGMFPNTGEAIIATDDLFHQGQIVYDLVYNPLETKLLSMARARSATTINGLEMLLFQGAASFQMWTGKEMPVKKVRKELQSALKQCEKLADVKADVAL